MRFVLSSPVFSFARARYDVRSVLWPAVLRKLICFANIIPLLFQDMRAAWTEDDKKNNLETVKILEKIKSPILSVLKIKKLAIHPI